MYQPNLFDIGIVNTFQTIYQFVQGLFPPSFEANPDFNFLTAWGCEEYIKRTRLGNVERMRTALKTDYLSLLFSRHFQECLNEDKSPNLKLFEEKLKGQNLVKAKKDLTGLFGSQAPKGCYGVVLWKEPDKRPFVWFLTFNYPMIKPLIGPMSDMDASLTGAIFDNFQQVISLSKYQKNNLS